MYLRSLDIENVVGLVSDLIAADSFAVDALVEEIRGTPREPEEEWEIKLTRLIRLFGKHAFDVGYRTGLQLG